MRPGVIGGANWGGGAFDPTTGMLYVKTTSNNAAILRLPAPDRSPNNPRAGEVDADFINRGPNATFMDGLPLLKPPYGHLTAIDLNRGEIAWRVHARRHAVAARASGAEGRRATREARRQRRARRDRHGRRTRVRRRRRRGAQRRRCDDWRDGVATAVAAAHNRYADDLSHRRRRRAPVRRVLRRGRARTRSSSRFALR